MKRYAIKKQGGWYITLDPFYDYYNNKESHLVGYTQNLSSAYKTKTKEELCELARFEGGEIIEIVDNKE